jgi:hypothetical protein
MDPAGLSRAGNARRLFGRPTFIVPKSRRLHISISRIWVVLNRPFAALYAEHSADIVAKALIRRMGVTSKRNPSLWVTTWQAPFS